MTTTTQQAVSPEKSAAPWWKFGHVWLVLAGPIIVVIAGLTTVLGFALIWHMWPLVIASFAATILASIIHTFNYKRDYYIPASEVATSEEARTKQLAAAHV